LAHPDIVVFQWNPVAIAGPNITGVTAEPEFELIRQPGFIDGMNTYRYTTSGANLGLLHATAYDTRGI
jgi:hypothetical protein